MEHTSSDLNRPVGMANGATGMAQTVVDQVTEKAGVVADTFRSTTDYVRNHDVKAMGRDVENLVKRYPGQALLASAVLGFFVARAMRSRA
jgi:hypothetical protein